PESFKRIAVIGSGTMGSGICALLACCGCDVLLFDIASNNNPKRSAAAKKAKEFIASKNLLTHSKYLSRIHCYNLTDDLKQLNSCGMVVECIIENLAVKRNLYKMIIPHLKVNAVISSNTSTLPLAELIEDLPKNISQNFVITHFFNPPTIMPLLELVTHKGNNPDLVARLYELFDNKLGKMVVMAHDRPGFIANRLGCFWLEHGLATAIANGITPVDADFLISKIFSIPKTGIFGLWDLIGIDVMRYISSAITSRLPQYDMYNHVATSEIIITSMIEQQRLGRKNNAGFYQKAKDKDGKSVIKVLNMVDNTYSEQQVSAAAKKLAKCTIYEIFNNTDKHSLVMQEVMAVTLNYAASLVEEVADNLQAIDDAMELGFAWKMGPFKMIDHLAANSGLGIKFLNDKLLALHHNPAPFIINNVNNTSCYSISNDMPQVLTKDGNYLNLDRPRQHVKIAYLKQSSSPFLNHEAGRLWTLGRRVVVVELTTKLGSLNEAAFKLLKIAMEEGHRLKRALVIYNDAPHFSAGADLKYLYQLATAGNGQAIDSYLKLGQTTFDELSQFKMPVVAAVNGIALGGGCELMLHAIASQVHAHAKVGLVETTLGLIPAFGGLKEMVRRSLFNTKLAPFNKQLCNNFSDVIHGTKFPSAELLNDELLQDPNLRISFNQHRLLYDAMKLAEDIVASDLTNISVTSQVTYDGKKTEDILLNYVSKNGLREVCPYVDDIVAVI
ncbi:MAG: 3-hydroxyacyl-CoA dehydrogenase NAD-binding domain-containing protein, partial [Pseudomonadota bacterium]